MSVASLLSILLGVVSSQPASDAACPRQPLPPAVDALDPILHTSAITFAATPSLEVPGRAWVVRLSQRGSSGPAAVEIVRLRRQRDCNRYDVDRRWQAVLPEEQFRSLARRLRTFVVPADQGTPGANPLGEGGEVAVDGTGITLRIATPGWVATRQLEASGQSGAPVSSIFHSILSEHVPEAEQPNESWRVRRAAS